MFLFPLMKKSIGQEILLVKKIKNGKEHVIEKGSKITFVRFHEEEYTTEILHSFLDSAVVLGIDTIVLKDIAGIRKKNPLHKIARIAGMPLMLIGSIYMGQGAANMYSNPESDIGIKYFLMGAGIFAIGYAPYYFEMGDLTFGPGGEHTLKIQKRVASTQ